MTREYARGLSPPDGYVWRPVPYLDLTDLDEQRGTLLVRQGKGDKDRVVPIGERAVAWVMKYLADGRPELLRGGDTKALFVNRFGNRLTGSGLTKMANGHVRAADVGKNAFCLRLPVLGRDLDAGERGGHPLHPGDAGTREADQHAGLHAGVHAKLKAVHTATHPAALLEGSSRTRTTPRRAGNAARQGSAGSGEEV